MKQSKLFDDEISQTSRDRIQFFIPVARERRRKREEGGGGERDRKRGKRSVTNRNDSLYSTREPLCNRVAVDSKRDFIVRKNSMRVIMEDNIGTRSKSL